MECPPVFSNRTRPPIFSGAMKAAEIRGTPDITLGRTGAVAAIARAYLLRSSGRRTIPTASSGSPALSSELCRSSKWNNWAQSKRPVRRSALRKAFSSSGNPSSLRTILPPRRPGFRVFILHPIYSEPSGSIVTAKVTRWKSAWSRSAQLPEPSPSAPAHSLLLISGQSFSL